MFHKEGQKIIFITLALVIVITLLADSIQIPWIAKLIQFSLVVILVLILQFFRNPKRHTQQNESQVIAPVTEKLSLLKRLKKQNILKENVYKLAFLCPLSMYMLPVTL